MTSEELKEALTNRRPVIARLLSIGEIKFRYVSAIIYRRKENGAISVSAEVLDYNNNSVCIVDPKNIEFKEEKENV